MTPKRAALILAALALATMLIPWRFRTELDISSGRMRSETIVLGIRLGGAVEETDASKMFRELIGEPPPPAWRTVTDSTCQFFGQARAHPAHHGSGHAAGAIARAIADPVVIREAARKALETLFALLREGDGDGWAREYARDVESSISGRDPGKDPIEPDDLPPPPSR